MVEQAAVQGALTDLDLHSAVELDMHRAPACVDVVDGPALPVGDTQLMAVAGGDDTVADAERSLPRVDLVGAELAVCASQGPPAGVEIGDVAAAGRSSAA
jgi:hypothetical protein